MNATTCAKCGNTTFTVHTFLPRGAIHSISSVQCEKCGVAIGVSEELNTLSLLRELLNEHRAILTRLKHLEELLTLLGKR